jgi:multidrug resistance efflux pump
VGDRSRGRFATPTDSPLHDGSPYWGLHARRWGLGFVHRSRTILCRAVPNLNVTIRNSCVAVQVACLEAQATAESQQARARKLGSETTALRSATASAAAAAASAEAKLASYSLECQVSGVSGATGEAAGGIQR